MLRTSIYRAVVVAAILMSAGSITGYVMADTVAVQAQSFRAVAMTQVTKSDHSTAAAPGNSLAQDDVNRFNDLINDDLPGGFLDKALKSAKLNFPISVAPKDMDPRFVTLKRNLAASDRSSDVFVITLNWDNKDDAQAIVNALQQQYMSVVSGHETLVALNPVALDNLNKLELATLQFVADNNFHYPTFKDQKTLTKQLMPYLTGNRDTTQNANSDVFNQAGQGVPYGINTSLSDLTMAKVQDPADMVLFYETVADKDGNRYVGYADGDCKLIVAADWDAARKASNIP